MPPALLGRIAKAGTALVEQLGSNLLKSRAIAAGISEDEARPVIDSTKLAPELKELVADLTPEALKEWGMDPSVSPTGCIFGIFGVWGGGVFAACQTFDSERKRKEENAAKAQAAIAQN